MRFVGGIYGTTIDLDRETTKSESPEIVLSNLRDTDMPKGSRPNAASLTSPPPQSASTQQLEGKLADPDEGEITQMVEDASRHLEESSNLQAPPLQKVNRAHGSLRHSERVYDEIETDTESLIEKQRLHNPKRHKIATPSSERSSSPYAPSSSKRYSSDGRFKIPALPRSQLVGVPRLSKSSGARENKAGGHIEIASNQEQRAEQMRGTSESTRLSSPNDRPARLPQSGLTNGEINHHSSSDNSSTSTQTQDESANAGFQAAKNYSDLPLEHPIKQALSNGKKPNPSLLRGPVSDGKNTDKADPIGDSAVHANGMGGSAAQEDEAAHQLKGSNQQVVHASVESSRNTPPQAEKGRTTRSGATEHQTESKPSTKKQNPLAEDATTRLQKVINAEPEIHQPESKSKEVEAGPTKDAGPVEHKSKAQKSTSKRQPKEKTSSKNTEIKKSAVSKTKQLEFDKTPKQETPASTKSRQVTKENSEKRSYVRTPTEKEKRRLREREKRQAEQEAQIQRTTTPLQAFVGKEKTPRSSQTSANKEATPPVLQTLVQSNWASKLFEGECSEAPGRPKLLNKVKAITQW